MSQQAEQEVITSLLMDGSLMSQCDLQPQHFQNWHYQEIFNAMHALAKRNEVIDIITVSQLLEQTVPGTAFLPLMAELLDKSYGSGRNLRSYVKLIRKDFKLRQIGEIAARLSFEVRENKNADAADKAISELMLLNSGARKHDWTIAETMTSAVKVIEEAFEADGLVGIDTGLKDLNEATGGWHDTDLIVIPARPAMGKTALLLNLALSANCPVGIVSAEQAHEQVGLRMISMEGRLNSQTIRTAKLTDGDWPKLTTAVHNLKDRPIWINDEPNINIIGLIRQARQWKHRYGIKALYVDYVQKIKGSRPGMNATEQATEVVGALKDLAKELGIPVIALAQVNRNVESRPNKRPSMGDIADASAIEKEADIICILYRDEVYDEDSPDKGIAELDIDKNRHGPTGVIRCAFLGHFMRFEELAPKSYQQYGGAA